MADPRGSLGRFSNLIAPKLISGMRPSIGSAPITASMQDRLERIRKEFADIDANGDKMLTFDEIYSFLCRKTGRDFDKRLCQKLFDKMDKDRDSFVSADEFILSYIDAEKVYQSRIEELQKQIQDSIEQMEDSRIKMQSAANTEEPNSYGIMKGSVLTVNVVKAQNLLPMDIGGKSDPYVILSCENQQIETRYISNDLNPVWEETFTFQIQKGTEDLSVIVMDHDTLGRHDFEGQVLIPLQSIADQMKHDQFFDLHGKNPNEPWQGRIHLTLQWIWSKVRYWETLVNQWKENIEFDRQDLRTIQELLDKLKEPFAIVEQDVDSVVVQRSRRPGAAMAEYGGAMTSGITSYVETHLVSPFEWGKSAQLIFGVFVTLTLISMFLRPDFVNLSLGVLISMFMFTKQMTADIGKGLATAVAISELYDLIWFSIYLSVSATQHWASSDADAVESAVENVVVLASVANFILKVPVAAALWKLALEIHQPRS
jgi:Ca2+-binding EF-hand superfamily protein